MLHASGADDGGAKFTGCEELVDASQAEEDGVDAVFLEVLLHPGRVLDGAIEDRDAV